MPLFAELVRVDQVIRRPTEELVAMSHMLWLRHLGRRPPGPRRDLHTAR